MMQKNEMVKKKMYDQLVTKFNGIQVKNPSIIGLINSLKAKVAMIQKPIN